MITHTESPGTLDGDRVFPFYTVDIRFQIDGKPPEGWTRSIVEGKPDRQWTTMSKQIPLYYAERPDPAKVIAEATAFWDHNKDQVHGPKSYGPEGTPKFPNYSDFEITIGVEKWDTWMLTWFSHTTFRWGRSDEEILASFHRYVNRVERENGYGSEKTKAILMGAEDRWRWKGQGREGTEAPCSCVNCVLQGITKVDH